MENLGMKFEELIVWRSCIYGLVTIHSNLFLEFKLNSTDNILTCAVNSKCHRLFPEVTSFYVSHSKYTLHVKILIFKLLAN